MEPKRGPLNHDIQQKKKIFFFQLKMIEKAIEIARKMQRNFVHRLCLDKFKSTCSYHLMFTLNNPEKAKKVLVTCAETSKPQSNI